MIDLLVGSIFKMLGFKRKSKTAEGDFFRCIIFLDVDHCQGPHQPGS